ncbi:MAG: hypothetical protein GWN58_61710 [Anaerolineae bacterium]|nr:hypothetical protein [Anaerolineae bacterium]
MDAHHVASQLGLYAFDGQTRRMRLSAILPDLIVEQALAASVFELLVADEVGEDTPPSEDQQRIMHDLDPAGLILGR